MTGFVTSESIDVFTQRMALVGIADPAFWTRFGVHYGLFLGALRSGATSNQMSELLVSARAGLTGRAGPPCCCTL